MVFAVEFSNADGQLLQQVAGADNISAEEFIMKATQKAMKNAAYLAKLDRADEQIREGKVVYKTMTELEAMEQ